jgi:hypothetical protein
VYEYSGIVTIESGDSLTFQSTISISVAETYSLCVAIYPEGDQNAYNNSIIRILDVYECRTSIIINEIKFLTIDEEVEWIEVYNTGGEPLSLKHWAVCDSRDTCKIDSSVGIGAREYKVISSRHFPGQQYQIKAHDVVILDCFPGLNNEYDTISLLHPLHGVTDLVAYNKSWLEGEDWRSPSLERIHGSLNSNRSTSWGPSTALQGATPGYENSIHTSLSKKQGRIDVNPHPFSPNGDGFEDYALISVQSDISAGRIRIFIYNIFGQKIRTIENNRFFGSQASYVWDGKNDNGKYVRMGIYIVYVQILDDRNGKNMEYKTTLTVAKPL